MRLGHCPVTELEHARQRRNGTVAVSYGVKWSRSPPSGAVQWDDQAPFSASSQLPQP